MNPEVLPTPYDIVSLPYFPYAPTLRDWLLLTIFFLVVILIVRLKSVSQLGFALELPKAQRYALDRCKKWRQDLAANTFSSAGSLQAIAFELSLLLRRVIESRWAVGASGMTARELKEYFSQDTNSLEPMQWASVLAVLESTKFQTEPVTASQMDALLTEAIMLLSAEPPMAKETHA